MYLLKSIGSKVPIMSSTYNVCLYTSMLSLFTVMHFQNILSEANHEVIRNPCAFSLHTGSMQLRSQLGYSFSTIEGLFIGEYNLL